MIRRLRRRLGAVAFLCTAAAIVVACGDSSAELDPDQAVNIRFRNETGGTIERLWLGAGSEGGSTFQTRYTDIDDGETTDYQTVEAEIDNYRAVNFTIDRERYSDRAFDPHGFLGVDSLAAGSYYTFTIALDEGSTAQLTGVVVDAP